MPILGKTLMNIGSQLPDIYRTNRRLGEERLDRQRRTEREDKTWEQQQEEYARQKALEREAQSAIEGYESGVRAQTPLPEGQEGPVAPQRSRYELGMESGLPRYQNISPEAKGLWGAVEEEEKGRRSSEAIETKLGLQQQKMDQQEQQFNQRMAQQESLFSQRLANQRELAELKQRQKKEKPVSQNIALQLSATKQGIEMLDNLVEKSPTFNTLTNSPLDRLRAINPWDEDVQSFNQLIATTKQVIGKGLEGGVLRKEDEVKYEKILPKLGEPLNVRQQKGQQLRDMLVNKYQSDIGALESTGADVTKFEKMSQKTYGQDIEKENKSSWNDEKESRYQELLRKKQSGTIGK